MWQVLIIFYFIFGVSSFLLRKLLAQKFGEHIREINSVYYLFFLLPTGIILSFIFPHNFNVGLTNLIFLFGGSIIWPISNLVSFHANKKVDVGIFAIITNLSPLFTLAIALPFLHEHLTILQYLGIGLLIFSGVIAAASQLHKHNRANLSGILICFLVAIIFGVAVTYERFMLNRIDFGTYLFFGWGAQVFWALTFAGKRLKKLPELFSRNLQTRQLLLFFGATSALRSTSFILALKIGSASIMNAASDFMSVAVFIGAYFFLKERDHMIYKWFAVILGVVGLLFIAK